MKNQSEKTQRLFLALVLALGLAVPALHVWASEAPQPVQRGDILYVTGGVDSDERAALEATAKDYNLRITNADKDSHLTLADSLVIKSAKGDEVIRLTGVNPIFYGKLPPGRYTVEATNGDKHRTERIDIAKGKPADIHFIW